MKQKEISYHEVTILVQVAIFEAFLKKIEKHQLASAYPHIRIYVRK
jgi:hypothetical protein